MGVFAAEKKSAQLLSEASVCYVTRRIPTSPWTVGVHDCVIKSRGGLNAHKLYLHFKGPVCHHESS